LALKHKLPSSVFTAEAWAIYQSLILIESADQSNSVIFSDSRSVLDALSFSSGKSCTNFLIPIRNTIRNKFHIMNESGFSIKFVWIPFYIPGNERVDAFAKLATLQGHKPKFKTLYTDFYSSSTRDLREGFQTHLINEFRIKGIMYFRNFFKSSSKP